MTSRSDIGAREVGIEPELVIVRLVDGGRQHAMRGDGTGTTLCGRSIVPGNPREHTYMTEEDWRTNGWPCFTCADILAGINGFSVRPYLGEIRADDL